jgi:hypothetical protein
MGDTSYTTMQFTLTEDELEARCHNSSILARVRDILEYDIQSFVQGHRSELARVHFEEKNVICHFKKERNLITFWATFELYQPNEKKVVE